MSSSRLQNCEELQLHFIASEAQAILLEVQNLFLLFSHGSGGFTIYN
jgi:hypothetical protein